MRCAIALVCSLLVSLVCLGGVAASVLRIDITKRVKGPVVHKLQVTRNAGAINSVELVMPAKQKSLRHLWRVDLWIKDHGRVSLVVPMQQQKSVQGTYRYTIAISRALMAKATIVLRTGPHAPLAETMYTIDLGAHAHTHTQSRP